MTPMPRADGLGHRYGRGVWGVRDCTVVVPPRRVVALVGPNGAGKTTLLDMAAGLLPPTTGTVPVTGAAPARRLDRIGYVAQDAPLWPRLRVADVLEVGRCLDPRFDTTLATERIRRLDIPLRARTNTLSGGQRAQVALTLVLGKRPSGPPPAPQRLPPRGSRRGPSSLVGGTRRPTRRRPPTPPTPTAACCTPAKAGSGATTPKPSPP